MLRHSFPTTLILPPYEFEVHADAQRLKNQEHEDKMACWGYLNQPRLEVGIDPNQAEAAQRVTFLHEVCHAILLTKGYRHKRVKKEEQWEELITVFALGLLSFCQQNPTAISWLCEMGDDPPQAVEEVNVPEGMQLSLLPLTEGSESLCVPQGRIFIPQETTDA